MTDVPPELGFVDPSKRSTTLRFCLWAAPGQGKSVGAATAPSPNLVVNADRPSAYAFARKLHPEKDIRETYYTGEETLQAVYVYLRDDEHGKNVATVTIDPVSNVIDQLRSVAPKRSDGDTDHEWVNKKFIGFLRSLRALDVNVVLVAHEKLNDTGKKADGKMYPSIGGGTLINKVLAEMDVCAHVERLTPPEEDADPDEIKWVGQLQPVGNLVCKEGTGALGDVRVLDLTRWVELAAEFYAADDSDLPWTDDPEAEAHVEAEERELDADFEKAIAEAFPGSTVEPAPKTKRRSRAKAATA
jgi:hypothetical protein